MIVRQPKQSNFTLLSNIPVIDLNLSAVSLGLYVYIISKPDNWKAHKNEILKRFENASIKTTKNMIDAAFSELIAAGYIKIITPRTKNAQGKTVFLGKQYHFFETPNEAALFSEEQHLRQSEISDIGKSPTSEDLGGSEKLAHITSTDLLTSTETKITSTEIKTSAEKSATFKNENIDSSIVEVEPLEDKHFEKEKEKSFAKKEKEKICIFPANFPTALMPYAEKFFEYRKEIKKPYKSNASIQTKLKQFIQEAEQHGVQAVIESIETAIGQGWIGTFIDKKYTNNPKQKPTGATIPASDQAQRDELALLKTKCHNKRIDFSHVTGTISEQIIQIKKLL